MWRENPKGFASQARWWSDLSRLRPCRSDGLSLPAGRTGLFHCRASQPGLPEALEI